jgi:hypothetical protein
MTDRGRAELVGLALALVACAAPPAPTATAPPAAAAEPPWERSSVRVEDTMDNVLLNRSLQRGWQVERADSDGKGTTYVLRRDPRTPSPILPTPVPPSPTPTSVPPTPTLRTKP